LLLWLPVRRTAPHPAQYGHPGPFADPAKAQKVGSTALLQTDKLAAAVLPEGFNHTIAAAGYFPRCAAAPQNVFIPL
jgi:hypothetical protein